VVGITKTLSLGDSTVKHLNAGRFFDLAHQSPVVDGGGVRDAMERWAIRLAADLQPGIWSRKRVLLVPGLNHNGLAQAFGQYSQEIRYADPGIYFSLPSASMIGRAETLDIAEGFTLSQLRSFSFSRLFPMASPDGSERYLKSFIWADILAGDIGAIRRFSPPDLKRKIVVTEYVTEEDVADLKSRGASAVVTTMPWLDGASSVSAAAFEGCLAAICAEAKTPASKTTYLNLMAGLDWKPTIITLQPDEAQINRFAFVIHPLNMSFIHGYRPFRWTRYLPDALVERIAAYVGPLYLGRITGIASPTNGQKVEGYLLALGATPRELMRRKPGFVYRRLIRASRMAERFGARIMGLGAFTSVIGDAGITVSQKSAIAVTSGNSLTVAATLEAAKQAVLKMGTQLENSHEGHVMVIGATGSIGSVCSRLLAQAGPAITLVAPRPEKLIELKRMIEEETPHARVTISITADDYVDQADLIVTTTSAIDTQIIDITKCKPGAVICDIARPPDISPEEAALRPDVLVIESGEILLPGDPDYGYDIGLPPGVAYACLAETALLAMEGRFESYTLGRNIEIERVKEMYRLFKKHQLKLSGLRSHGQFLTDEDIAKKRDAAEKLRQNSEMLQFIRTEVNGNQKFDREANRVQIAPQVLSAAGIGALVLALGAIGWKLRRKR
jgi:predicted amino acid dehydrogenase